MKIDKIMKSRRKKRKFRKAFEKIMSNYGEYLMGEVETDYILKTFKRQGFWSGIKYRIYFSYGYGFEATERRFGK